MQPLGPTRTLGKREMPTRDTPISQTQSAAIVNEKDHPSESTHWTELMPSLPTHSTHLHDVRICQLFLVHVHGKAVNRG